MSNARNILFRNATRFVHLILQRKLDGSLQAWCNSTGWESAASCTSIGQATLSQSSKEKTYKKDHKCLHLSYSGLDSWLWWSPSHKLCLWMMSPAVWVNTAIYQMWNEQKYKQLYWINTNEIMESDAAVIASLTV